MLIPTSYLPPIEYVALLTGTPSATVEVCETFPKQTFRNRAEIMTSNGVMRLSVPVVRTGGNHTATGDIGISYAERWNVQHIRAIESAYNNAPYFMYLWDGLKEILNVRHDRLTELNSKIMEYLLSKLSIRCRLRYSEEYVKPEDGSVNDMRGMFARKSTVQRDVFTPYYQVWNDRYAFCPNLSIIDLLFNMGPDESRGYLKRLSTKKWTVDKI